MISRRTVLRVLSVLAILGGQVVSPGSAQEPAFFAAVNDLPRMPALREAADGALVFDSPSGRIAEVYAAGTASRESVLDFYAQTLPQLGWAAESATRFRREGEVLDIQFPDAGGDSAATRSLTVRFSLAPAAAR